MHNDRSYKQNDVAASSKYLSSLWPNLENIVETLATLGNRAKWHKSCALEFSALK